MASGLKVWDKEGRLTLDTSTRLGRVLGLVVVGRDPGHKEIPAFATGQPFFKVYGNFENSAEAEEGFDAWYRPQVSITGTQLNWTSFKFGLAYIIYGVY